MQMSLKAVRVNKNMTQKEASRLIGVTKETLASWENKKTFPTADKIKRITEVYGVSYDDIIFL